MKRNEKHLVNFAQLLRIIGLLMMFEAMFMVFPMLTCLY